MGTFNGTCAVSHLPIEDGDAVAGFLLTRPFAPGRGESFEGYTGPGTVWQAVSLPFHGTYDGYGSVELAETGNEVADAMAKLVTGRTLGDTLGIGKEGDDPSEGAAKGMTLRLTLVHRGLFDRLSSEEGGHVLAEEVGKVAGYLSAMRASHAGHWAATHGGEPTMPLGNLGDAEEWCVQTGRPHREIPYVARFFEHGTGIAHQLRMALKAHLNLADRNGDAETQAALLEPALRLSMLDGNMGKLRRTWAPQSGLGSDDEDMALHREVAEWASARCLEVDPDCARDAGPRP
jgi:hypothetical protein